LIDWLQAQVLPSGGEQLLLFELTFMLLSWGILKTQSLTTYQCYNFQKTK
jgi:hypothetical protein